MDKKHPPDPSSTPSAIVDISVPTFFIVLSLLLTLFAEASPILADDAVNDDVTELLMLSLIDVVKLLFSDAVVAPRSPGRDPGRERC